MLLLLRFYVFLKFFLNPTSRDFLRFCRVSYIFSNYFFLGGGGPTRGTGNSNTDDLVLITDRQTHAKISLRPVSLTPAPF